MKFKNFNKIKLAELIGILFSDGWICYKTSSRAYRIGVTNKSDFIHRKFKNLSKILFNVKKFSKGESQGHIPTTFFYSKDVFMFLLSLMNSARTQRCLGCNKRGCYRCKPVLIFGIKYPTVIIPKFIMTNKNNSIHFLRAMYSCDGSVLFADKRREIALHCCHYKLSEQVAKILCNLGFQKFSVTNERVSIFRKIEIKRFDKLIGFWPIKVRGRWEGKTKSKVLKLLVKTC